jgi:hypothetical protein
MDEIVEQKPSRLSGSDEEIRRRQFHFSQSASRIRHGIDRQARADEKNRHKFFRRRLGATAAVLALGIGGSAAAITLLKSGSSPIHHRIVKQGETLSQIAADELKQKGDHDPSTKQINDEEEQLITDSPDLQADRGGVAAVGDVINLR